MSLKGRLVLIPVSGENEVSEFDQWCAEFFGMKSTPLSVVNERTDLVRARLLVYIKWVKLLMIQPTGILILVGFKKQLHPV
jgi:hypothetical protein